MIPGREKILLTPRLTKVGAGDTAYPRRKPIRFTGMHDPGKDFMALEAIGRDFVPTPARAGLPRAVNELALMMNASAAA